LKTANTASDAKRKWRFLLILKASDATHTKQLEALNQQINSYYVTAYLNSNPFSSIPRFLLW